MPTPLGNLRTNVEAWVLAGPIAATALSASAVADNKVLSADFRVPSGELKYSVAVGLATQTGDSNVNYSSAEVRIRIHYNPPLASDATTFMEDHLWTIGLVLLDRAQWRANVANEFYEVTGGPEAAFPEIEGNVITVEYVAIVSILQS